jgi:Zn-dependent protease
MPLLLFFATSGALVFGFAKPLPVRYGNLRSPKRDMVWVALAGPGSNFAMGLIWYAALYMLQGAGVSEVFFIKMCEGGVLVNVVMCVFNLFPLPPLDGGRVLTGLLPYRAALAFSKIERWGFFIVMALVVTKIIDDYWMRPLMALNFITLDFLLSPLAAVLNAAPTP